MNKKLPEAEISRELTQSVFFSRPALGQPAAHVAKPIKVKPVKPRFSSSKTSHSPAAKAREQTPEPSKQAVHEAIKQEGMTDSNRDVNHDVMTSQSQDIDLRAWQEIIENTETQNTALRLTTEERYAIEDAVNELRRKYGIKTSMNEVARLGLMLIIHDFKKNKKESLIHQVKKA